MQADRDESSVDYELATRALRSSTGAACTFCDGTGEDTFASDAADGQLVTFTCWVCRGTGVDSGWYQRALDRDWVSFLGADTPRREDKK